MNKELSKKNAVDANEITIASEAIKEASNADQPKKLVIIGLPSATAAKTGFGAPDSRPGYKAKSSKKTGAKYRVRQ
jgi:hypothetical protein